MARVGDPVALARSQVGKPYVWAHPVNLATANPRSFDCSGLVEWAWWHAGGPKFPFHNSAEMYLQLKAAGRTRPYADRRPGDAVFYNDGGIIHHVAMVDYDVNSMVTADDVGIPVRVTPIRTFGLMHEVGAFPGAVPSGGGLGLAASGPTAPYPVQRGSDGGWQVQVSGKWYSHILVSGDESGRVPNSAVTRMAQYQEARYKLDNNSIPSLSPSNDWLAGKHDVGTKQAVVGIYCQVYSPPRTASPIPGSGAVGDAVSGIAGLKDLIAKAMSADFWLRAGEVALGIVVVGVAVDKLAKG